MSDKLFAEIAAERRRQIEVEGWTPEHDDKHDDGSLGDAAACYAASSTPILHRTSYHGEPGYSLWPWDEPKKDHPRRRELVIAGGLIVAEIERLDRLAEKGKGR